MNFIRRRYFKQKIREETIVNTEKHKLLGLRNLLSWKNCLNRLYKFQPIVELAASVTEYQIFTYKET